jgi:hypothetical protein
MAELLGLNPNPETWPIEMLDRLVRLEVIKGRRELLFEIAKLARRIR